MHLCLNPRKPLKKAYFNSIKDLYAVQSMMAVAELAFTTTLSSVCAQILANPECCTELLTLVKAFQRGGASWEKQHQLFTCLGNIAACSDAVHDILAMNVGLLASQLQTTRDHEVSLHFQ